MTEALFELPAQPAVLPARRLKPATAGEPYYQTERVALYLADARDVLPTFPKEHFDLVVTDPPYGVEFVSNMRRESFGAIANDGADDRGVVEEILLECVRLVGQNRHLYVFGPEVLAAIGAKVSEPAEMVWVKQDGPGMGDLSSPWGPQYEPLWFYVSVHRHAGKTGKTNNPVRLRKGNVLTFNKPTGRTVRHPTEKPTALLAELIESSSRAGETVLDPCAGVGSTGVAALLRGRKTVLVEENEEYAAIAAARLQAAEQLWLQGASL